MKIAKKNTTKVICQTSLEKNKFYSNLNFQNNLNNIDIKSLKTLLK